MTKPKLIIVDLTNQLGDFQKKFGKEFIQEKNLLFEIPIKKEGFDEIWEI